MNLSRRYPSYRPLLLGGVALLALSFAACGGTSSPKDGSHSAGTVLDDPGGPGVVIVDANGGGERAELRIVRVAYGRLVDVYGFDTLGRRVLMQPDFLIGPDLQTNGQDFVLEANAVTGREALLVLRDVDDLSKGGGRAQFIQILLETEKTLAGVVTRGLGDAGVYAMVPRNSTLMVQFDDLLDAKTLSAETVRTGTGVPPTLPFEARLVADPNHGDFADHDGEPGEEFYSTRVLVDCAVSELDSFATDPPLPINPAGLPGSQNVDLANVVLRFPTRTLGFEQPEILRNPTEHGLATTSNGPVDFASSTDDVVRAMRSGGDGGVTGDPFNGFLRDEEPPRLVGEHGAFLAEEPLPLDPLPEGTGTLFLLPHVVFDSAFCAQTAVPGDVFTQDRLVAQVLETSAPVEDGELVNVSVRLLAWPPYFSGPEDWAKTGVGPVLFGSPWDPLVDAGREACMLRLIPQPTGYPEQPAQGLFTSTTIGVRFSEPMAPSSLSPFDGMLLSRVLDVASGTDVVVGRVLQAVDLGNFTWIPELPLTHEEGEQESYWLALASGARGATDLVGNPLAGVPSAVELELETSQPAQRTGGRASRFVSSDEEEPFGNSEIGPLPEWAGQAFFDAPLELLRPRPVQRFQEVIDSTQPVPGLHAASPAGVQDPLNPFGARLQTVWRFVDVGFDLWQQNLHNIDVEGLHWSPHVVQAVFDSFEEFEISFQHATWAPDEGVGGSGLEEVYLLNALDPAVDALAVMHPRGLGYAIHPGEASKASSGTLLMPFPLNRSGSPTEHKTYTWRDTEIRKRGGADSLGAPPLSWYAAMNLPLPLDDDGNLNLFYSAGQVQTVGLPLLLEFRCWPDIGATGHNRFATSLGGIAFRAYSGGGIDTSFTKIYVDPDLETTANGGYDPTSQPPGQKTPGLDSNFYIGALDFVVRVSRVHSVWFPAADPAGGFFAAPSYATPVAEPGNGDQPQGTSMTFAFRGATSISDNAEATDDALSLDLYGDHYLELAAADGSFTHDEGDEMNAGIAFLSGDDSWHEDSAAITGAPYYQVRVTFAGNVLTGESPRLASFGLAWWE